MEQMLPSPHEEGGLDADPSRGLHGDHLDPQRQVVPQNLRVALLPLAIIVFTLIALAAVAWTFLTALASG